MANPTNVLARARITSHRTRRTIRRIWRHPSNRHRRLRRLAYASFFQIWARITDKPLKVTVGRRSHMFVYLHFAAASEVVYANPPSAEVMVWSRHLKPGDRFIDVGANVGVYTLFALEQGADVLAFEPNSEAAKLFRQNMALNHYNPELQEIALSDKEGSMEMTFDLGVANHLMFRDDDERSDDIRRVGTTTLDDVIGDGEVAGVKIDTEGCERVVLQGAARALAEHRIKLLQLEWNFTSKKVLGETREPLGRMLEAAGYKLMRPNAQGELVRPVENFRFGPDVFAVLATVG